MLGSAQLEHGGTASGDARSDVADVSHSEGRQRPGRPFSTIVPPPRLLGYMEQEKGPHSTPSMQTNDLLPVARLHGVVKLCAPKSKKKKKLRKLHGSV